MRTAKQMGDFVGAVVGAAVREAVASKYSDDQPRDDHGRFASGDGGGGAGSSGTLTQTTSDQTVWGGGVPAARAEGWNIGDTFTESGNTTTWPLQSQARNVSGEGERTLEIAVPAGTAGYHGDSGWTLPGGTSFRVDEFDGDNVRVSVVGQK